ncbi:GH39 family glycosyl hydrolase [Paenibacillus sp. NRS-1760]|uniref:GH39 family glycosyl hydrolase n=1 Tax=Paenibacillus sp. NRS-1760 TaxID=3233902 RepID=UPI003D264EF6
MRYLYEFIEHQDDLPIRLFVNSVAHVHFHWHKEIEIIYVLQGSVTIYLDQHQYLLQQDDIIVVSSMSVHKIERTSQDNVLLTLQFNPELMDEGSFIGCNSLQQTDENRENYDKIRRCLAQMAWEASKKAPGCRNYSLGFLHMLIGHLLRYFSTGLIEATLSEGKAFDYKRLNRVLQFVDRHYSQKISLQTIADQEHLSLHYFSHFFSDKIGIPFQKYLTLVRLEKAVIELTESSKSMTQIAHDCGFANVKLFNKYFKEKYECTPSAFREAVSSAMPASPARKPITYEESSSSDYYETDTILAMESLYRYLERDEEGTNALVAKSVVYNKVDIKVRVDESGQPFVPHWNRITTAGRAIEGLRADWQEQFLELQRNLAFTHIRFHGVFNDEMMIYNETDDGEPIYNWAYVDKLYDFLLQSGIRPFVELGFMPTLLRRSSETIFLWKGNIAPPAIQNKWDSLVRQFVRHCLNRYGIDEVKKWYFEVWNEPDLAGVCWAGTKEQYFEFYKSTAFSIKSINLELKVGGPALGYGSLWNESWATDFMSYCRAGNVPIDFFSFHVYSEYPNLKDEADTLTTIMPPSFYLDSVNKLRSQIGAYEAPHMELHMTEWNFSLYDRNLVHDTMFMASFVIHQALQTLGTMNSIAFWSFTDVFEESHVPPSIFYGGFGLINRNGLKKPSYYAFELLAKLGEKIVTRGDGYIVTSHNDGSLQILMYHYVHVDQLFASGDWSGLTEKSRYSIFEEKGDKAFLIKLQGLKSSYKMTSYQLDREHGSAFDEWIRMGTPVYPSKEELNYLQGKTGPEMKTELITDAESYEHTFVVPPHGVRLITLLKQY